jgi:superoxide dismutase, Cu-Zn family
MNPLRASWLVAAISLLLVTSSHADDRATVEFKDRDGNAVGSGTLREGPAGVLLRLKLDGLGAGWKAIHVHRTGTCHDHGEGFQASGPHLDPDDREHGLLNADGPELGDLPNIYSHDGVVRAEIFIHGARLDDSERGLLRSGGTALVIHENPDDHRSQPIGGAGARIACGVIGRER